MAKIKVWGYLYPEPDEIDESDPMGLTGDAYLSYSDQFMSLDDLHFEPVAEDD